VEALKINTYFICTYTRQYKGIAEKRIGQSRSSFPKKTYLNAVIDQQVKKVEQILYQRPLRKFKYKTPNQVLQK
jgi:IS30 family transposase